MPPSSQPDPLRGIDQLRGLAILLVLGYHAGGLGWRLPPYRPDGWLALPHLGAAWLLVPLFHFGFAGVHLFFVLSGFCIHLRAARMAAAGRRDLPSVREFLLRRFWRIVPPYWIALGLFGLAVPLAARALRLAADPAAGASDLALHAALLHSFSPRTIFSINPAFWSLATEAQFYLAYPLLLPHLRRIGMRRVLALALGLSLAWRGVVLATLPPTVEHFMAYRVLLSAPLPPRWFEWLLGCALAEAWAARAPILDGGGRRLAIAGAALLVLAMAARVHVVVDKLASDALFSSGFAALGGAVLAARGGSSLVGALVGRALAAVGHRAYGIYLVHQPILDWQAAPRLLRNLAAPVAGWLFSALAERPFERRAGRVGDRARRAA